MTPKQALFVAEYLIDLNATQAAIRAGYSERTSNRMGSENLAKPVIAAAIAEAQAERLNRVQVTADEVLRLLKRRAHANLKQVARWGVKEEQAFLEPYDSDELSEDIAAGIAEIAIGKDGALRLKMHSQDGAVALLARHAGIVAKDGEGGGAPVQVNVFVDRAPPETREQWLERVQRERLGAIDAQPDTHRA